MITRHINVCVSFIRVNNAGLVLFSAFIQPTTKMTPPPPPPIPTTTTTRTLLPQSKSRDEINKVLSAERKARFDEGKKFVEKKKVEHTMAVDKVCLAIHTRACMRPRCVGGWGMKWIYATHLVFRKNHNRLHFNVFQFVIEIIY